MATEDELRYYRDHAVPCDQCGRMRVWNARTRVCTECEMANEDDAA